MLCPFYDTIAPPWRDHRRGLCQRCAHEAPGSSTLRRQPDLTACTCVTPVRIDLRNRLSALVNRAYNYFTDDCGAGAPVTATPPGEAPADATGARPDPD